jgi:tripartite ATP-independent transporter DctP family solute receptor
MDPPPMTDYAAETATLASWSVRTSRALFFSLLGGLLLCVGFAVQSVFLGEGEVRKLRVAHTLPEQHPVHRGIARFAERLAVLSGGRLTVTVFANGQLGSETQYLEQLQSGTLDIAKVSAAPMGNFVPAFQVFSVPFLFPDETARWRALESAAGQELLHATITRRADGSPSGLVGLAYYDAGARSFYAKEPIPGPEAIRGRKWRVMSDVIAMDMVDALGGSPTPIAFAELYSALTQGVVDGAENNPPSLLSSRHYEVSRHYSLTEHMAIPDVLVMSARARARLTPEQQAWVNQAAVESALYQRALWAEETAAALQQLRKLGVEVTTPDRAAYTARTARVLASRHDTPLGAWAERLRVASQLASP